MRSALYDIRGAFQVELPDHGVLDFRAGPGEVVFLSLYGGETTFAEHPLARPGEIRTVVAGGDAILVGDSAVYHFRADRPALRQVAALERWGDSGFSVLEVLEHVGCVYVVYEGGALRVTLSGRLDWHARKTLWPAESVEIVAGALEVGSEGVVTRFRLDDGEPDAGA